MLITGIYPVDIRGQAMSTATMANWGAHFIITISFLTLLNAIHGYDTFFIFSIVSLVAVIYCIIEVPETKGRALEDSERQLGG